MTSSSDTQPVTGAHSALPPPCLPPSPAHASPPCTTLGGSLPHSLLCLPALLHFIFTSWLKPFVCTSLQLSLFNYFHWHLTLIILTRLSHPLPSAQQSLTLSPHCSTHEDSLLSPHPTPAQAAQDWGDSSWSPAWEHAGHSSGTTAALCPHPRSSWDLTASQNSVTFGCTSVKPHQLCCQISSCCSEGAVPGLASISVAFHIPSVEKWGYQHCWREQLYYYYYHYSLMWAKYLDNFVFEDDHCGLARNCQKWNLEQIFSLEHVSPTATGGWKTRCCGGVQGTKQSSARALAWMGEIFRWAVLVAGWGN